VLKTTPNIAIASFFDEGPMLPPQPGPRPSRGADHVGVRLNGLGPRANGAMRPILQISPSALVRRQTVTGRTMTAEIVQSTSRERIEYRYRAASDLLVAYEQGIRRDGETLVEGIPGSTLHDFARKLTFVPAGHDYLEWHEPRTSTRLMFFYLDTAARSAQSSPAGLQLPCVPRVFFEDSMLWSTVLKLKGLVENPLPSNRAYFDALGDVLVEEIARSHRGAGGIETGAKGGLAAWQQRVVASYIEEHLAEQVPLATLAQLARLSPYHFSRAFKQSFGVPPHRYHTRRRIEQAKALLEDRALSVTEIGLALGFSETSSFTTAFRKTTGLTPSLYHRSLA
jgi:AraC family transcriptional regulator